MTRIQRTARRGDTIPFYLALSTDETGRPWVDFSDYRLTFTLKAKEEDPDSAAIVQLHSGAGGGITAGTTALWQVAGELLEAGATYFYDLQLQRLSTGAILTLEVGTFTISNDITRTTLP